MTATAGQRKISPVIIRTRNVSKEYRKGELVTRALRDITCEIRRGEFVSVMGPSGSGKSTFFNIIGALSTPTAGRVLIDEVDVAQLSKDELAYVRCKKIGYVFQSYNLVAAMTALENVTTPMLFAGVIADEARKRGMSLLERVGLKDKWFHLPKQLSGGQQQRVAIARAIVNDPVLVLADEPTGNLDSRSSEEIMAIFQQLNDEGRTILLVTHENEIAEHAKRIVRFRDGKIVSDVPVERQLRAKDLLDRMPKEELEVVV